MGWLDVITQAVDMGTTRFEIIGGDPFLRSDLLDLIAARSQGLTGPACACSSTENSTKPVWRHWPLPDTDFSPPC